MTTINDFTSVPLPAKDLINSQFPSHAIRFFAYGEGLWSADLVVNDGQVWLSGVYATDDWMVLEVSESIT